MSLSDFHRMTITVTEMAFQKLRLRLEFFDNKRYKNDLQKEIYNRDLEFTNNGFSRSVLLCQIILYQHAPRKQKYARGNHMPFLNNTVEDKTEENQKR